MVWPLLVLAAAVVASSWWARYTLVSRRIHGGGLWKSFVAGGFKHAAIMEDIVLDWRIGVVRVCLYDDVVQGVLFGGTVRVGADVDIGSDSDA
jgi:hypothetical protein